MKSEKIQLQLHLLCESSLIAKAVVTPAIPQKQTESKHKPANLKMKSFT